MESDTPKWAEHVARDVLAEPLPRRWGHTQGVAEQARRVGLVLGWDTDLIEASAWLHDIGYAPSLATTGFHPLDGARYLRDVEQADPVLCTLVAHHTGAVVEAAKRGLAEELLKEFPVDDPDALTLITMVTYCDLTTGPAGQRLTPEDRFAEILTRYEPGTPVHEAVSQSAPGLLEQCREITAALTARQRP